ncbi:CgeB family protein [Geomonas edaphica]|uniref:CgeB family protein n=1 Tax=Geomonas edaphica TaxID=2570226 RepID=UPI0010A76AAA|nr:glycosyltransferase [Geomonas edaphica]
MKILVAGDWHSELHEEAVCRAFSSLGHEIFRFSWHQYFKPIEGFYSFFAKFSRKLQNKLIAGPLIAQINADFVRTSLNLKPDVIFIYRGTHIIEDSLIIVKQSLPATILVGYNNDDPFADGHNKLLWRHFLAAVPAYDLMLAYRLHNIKEFRRIGAQRVELLRSWFIPERNRPVQLTPEEQKKFVCDVVFAGHYEPDGRDALLELILREGFNLKLFGPEWNLISQRSQLLRQLAPIVPLRGEDYNKALCGAKIALCLLSKLNRDTYTRRCFEIPAAGTFMLAEYSEDLASMFQEGVEAEFFRSTEELLEKLRYYLHHKEERQAVAVSGYHRVIADGHDVVSRMRRMLKYIPEVK